MATATANLEAKGAEVVEAVNSAVKHNGIVEQVVEAVKENELVEKITEAVKENELVEKITEAVKENDVVEKFNDVVSPVVNGVRQTMLAGVGAAALSYEQAAALLAKAVERGEITQKEAQQFLQDQWKRLRESSTPVEKVAVNVERGLEGMLHWLNIPSKRDIDDLSSKIDMLSTRVEDLRKRK